MDLKRELLGVVGALNRRWRWHLATVDDECLQLVPGSQRRYRTAHERDCLLESRQAHIPGQLAIKLKAGQTAFWSGDTIHRGVYRKDTERLTVAGSWAVHDARGLRRARSMSGCAGGCAMRSAPTCPRPCCPTTTAGAPCSSTPTKLSAPR